jgi:hypothetical protein
MMEGRRAGGREEAVLGRDLGKIVLALSGAVGRRWLISLTTDAPKVQLLGIDPGWLALRKCHQDRRRLRREVE